MATLEERFEWLREILEEGDGDFWGYFKSEIGNYLNIDEITAEDLEELLNKKFEIFQTCESYEDVYEFFYRIAGYVKMHLYTEEIIQDYLCRKSSIPIKVRQFNNFE